MTPGFRGALRLPTIAGALVLSQLVLFPSTAGAAEPRVIRLSVDNPDGNDRAKVEKKFAELLAKESNGALRVEIYYSGSLGGVQATAVQSLKAGGAEMTIVGTANFTRFNKRWNMFDLPFLFSSPGALYKYQAGNQFRSLIDDTIQKDGLRYVFPYYDGWRQLMTTSKQVKALADLSGLKLRSTPSPVEIAYDRALGAKPVSVPWNETYLGLKQGLVDGLMISYTSIVDFKMSDALSYGATLYVAPQLVVAFMREDFFQTLSNELQAAVLSAGRQTEMFAQSIAADADNAAREYLKGQGVKIVEVPMDARKEWRAATESVYEKFRDILTDKEQAAIQNLSE
jgi:TRAP-type C4-dicarboxylate transport system substrate-binding protein